MKKLFLIRHAKSSWKEPGLNDHDRPLNKRGKHDAPLMAEILKENGIIPDVIITSPAVRAYEFAKILANVMDYKKKDILVAKKLYLASADEMLKYIKGINDVYKTAFVIGHNPGITYLANELSGSNIDNIPTSGIAEFEFETGKWSEIEYGKGRLVSFEFPRKHYKD